MQTYRISVINQTFRATDDHELPSFEAARIHGFKAALAIGTEEVINGIPFFGAEILVENGTKVLGRFVVSIGASQLLHDGSDR